MKKITSADIISNDYKSIIKKNKQDKIKQNLYDCTKFLLCAIGVMLLFIVTIFVLCALLLSHTVKNVDIIYYMFSFVTVLCLVYFILRFVIAYVHTAKEAGYPLLTFRELREKYLFGWTDQDIKRHRKLQIVVAIIGALLWVILHFGK